MYARILIQTMSSQMKTTCFNPIQTELLKGINLIEASAGTGKTYTITMLVLRFIVEENISIDKVLVVTFTKAATEELKERVRTKLADAKRALEANTDNVDASIAIWLSRLAIEPQLIKQRINLALLDIDKASIFTIHGFCQRVLTEHALESGQLFDAELTGDLDTIKQACSDDFWRKTCYQRSPREVAILTARYKTPDALLASINFITDYLEILPEFESLDNALECLEKLTESAKTELDASAHSLQSGFAENKFKTSYTDAFEQHYELLSNWIHGKNTETPATETFAFFTENGIREGLHGNKFRASKNQTSEERKTDYLQTLAINTAPFDALENSVKHITLIFRRNLLETLRVELDKRLQQLNVLSFDNLITRLAEVLESKQGALLKAQLKQRFSATLIDEFQDTDSKQWSIFSSACATPEQYLYLIGDPKQAIYKFRGADIYAYLKAQREAEHQFTLSQNWRSQPLLVNAVNKLFQRERAFLLDDLEFNNVNAAKSENDGLLQLDNKTVPPMILWQLPEYSEPEFEKKWTAGKAGEEICMAVVNEIVSLLNENYQLLTSSGSTRIKPDDIAILVRTNAQARDYQTALRLAGVPSVLSSTESVFSSPEAFELYIVLQAVAKPGDSSLLKQALSLNWFGLDGQALYQLGNDEIALDAWSLRLLTYYQDWQKSGLIVMMQHLINDEKISLHLSKTLMAERKLTNLHHLVELIQLAVIEEHLGINKTLDWLHTALTSTGNHEDQQLRLESDDNAVKIITMHRSKGLEFSIVFCPCLWQRSKRLYSENEAITCHIPENEQPSTGMIVDLGSENFEQHRALALNEELAEDSRMFYVAVTRAKYRCYIAWANVRTEKKQNESAMAWLLEFDNTDFFEQQTKLQALQEENQHSFGYQLLSVNNTQAACYQKPLTRTKLEGKKRNRSLFTFWQMSSYTALSALSQHDAPELPEDRVGEQQSVFIADEEQPEQLPKGAHTGNVVHYLLENSAFRDLAQRKDISQQREKACLRYGLKLEQPELLEELLQAVVTTPLSISNTDFCLMNLKENQLVKEMPFYLSLNSIDTREINFILEDSPVYQPLSSKQMLGYLTGFIDLVCAYGEESSLYYVMDYKTNSLPNYHANTLIQSMREHNYGLQYWIYTVVLHRYLQSRVANYDYEKHFGGIRYLYVRGMQPDIPMSGVFEDRPELEKVEALAALFGG